MDGQSFGIPWMQHHNDMKTAPSSLILHSGHSDELLGNGLVDNGPESDQYLVDDDGGVPTEADIEQIAAENLIFMARDGQMVSEIIAAATDEHGAVVVAASDCGTVMQQVLVNGLAHQSTVICEAGEEDDGCHAGHDNDEIAYSADFSETTPQLVTEEIITDDWVQHQGEERVEIPAEQIIGSSSQVLLDIEVPLPTVQDEYTALRPYPCDFCSRRFRKKISLMNHMVAHQNDRPHLCKLCGSRFFRRSDLINHLKAHAEEPNQEFDDVEFMNFAEHEQQRPANDHYYDQDWSVQPDAIVIPTKSGRKLHSSNNNSASAASAIESVGTSAPTTVSTTGRGRISRLKPKEERYDYVVCEDELQAATAAVKLTQDHGNDEADRSQYPIIDDSKPFVCQQCGLAFAREKALLSHTKNHRNDSQYECSQCNEMFWDITTMQEHQKTHQFEESNSEYDPAEADDSQTDESETENLYGEFYCGDCGMSFHRQDLLRRHAKVHAPHRTGCDDAASVDNNKDQHCCNTCGETFDEPLELLAHAEIHARYPPFKCVLCGESFFDEPTIKRHLHGQHANDMTPNSCILCGKECRDRKALIKHAWDHSREKCHSCSKCGKNFHNKARLKRHMSSHRDKSVMCDVCQEEFPDGRSLSNHRHSHSASATGKLFPCNECGKTFGSRSSQQIHVRIHTGERPYGCRFCWKAFADGGTLRKHERIHTGEKPYACAVCPRAFNQRVVLREHIRSHHSGLDAKRGTYYCAVCSAELNSSADLMQHLIQHSDMNTAMQRQPISGPRKYKRRRKLKPHEIARMRSSSKQNDADSDINISDFDMDNVDDLLSVAENSTGTTIPTATAAISAKSAPKRNSKSLKTNAKNINNNNYAHNAAGGDVSNGVPGDVDNNEADNDDGDDNDEDSPPLHLNGHHNAMSSRATDKLWQTKLIKNNSNEETYKALLSNMENTLQSIDSLVVGTINSEPVAVERKETKKRCHESTAQRTQQVQICKNESMNTTSAAARTRKKPEKSNKIGGPRMIHTQKCHAAATSKSDGKRRGRSYITRTETANLELLAKSTNLVDDYEIMSPDAQPPNQISSSPPPTSLHIKQEPHPPPRTHHTSSSSQESGTSRSGSDLYDAQLLIDASVLRKEMLEKYNPSIVNDLEEILRSPLKMEKNERHRFTSESSTQFLVEPSEEEQHFIKIEPTSPDLREIVAGTLCHSSSVGLDNSVCGGGGGRRSARTTRVNRKYLGFETELNGATAGSSSVAATSQKRIGASGGGGGGGGGKGKGTPHKLSRKDNSIIAPLTPTFLPYDIDNYATASPSVSTAHSESASAASARIDSAAFSSIITADSNGTASNVTKHQPLPHPERKQRYFECEMCSAVFPDRAQLLDHVPIHI